MLPHACSNVIRPTPMLVWQVFDAPSVSGGFVERLAAARVRLSHAPSERVHVCAVWPCEDFATKDALLRRVVNEGGEGLILRRAHSAFVAGRSADLLKVKEWYDAEACVLRSNRPRGKDSLHCRSITGEVGHRRFEGTPSANFPHRGTIFHMRASHARLAVAMGRCPEPSST